MCQILCVFRLCSILKQALFFKAVVEISLSQQSLNRNQVKVAQIRETHCRWSRLHLVFGGVGVFEPTNDKHLSCMSSNVITELISDQKCCASHRFLLHHQMFGSRHHYHFKFCLPWSRENWEPGRLFRKLVSPAGKLCAGILLGTSGVNFTNILQAAFTCEDPKSAKKLLNLTVFICAFGICTHKSCL